MKKHKKTCNCGPCANMKANIAAKEAEEKALRDFAAKYPNAILIKDAFIEGYNSYATPACAYNTVEEAWDESAAKVVYDRIIGEQS